MKTFRQIPSIITFTLIIGCLSVFLQACYGGKSEGSISEPMVDAYYTSRRLFSYVWDPYRFYAKKNEDRIVELMDRLVKDFHKAESFGDTIHSDPSFNIMLTNMQNTLEDAKLRFTDGSKDYAHWRLRGVMSNCVACHSRREIPLDFVADEINFAPNSLIKGEFLFATRQFDLADDTLRGVVTESLKNPERGQQLVMALKPWMVIQVRVKDRPLEASKFLEVLLIHPGLRSDEKALLSVWVKDLKRISRMAPQGPKAADFIALSDELLAPIKEEPRIQENLNHLVTTLRASAYLHRVLDSSPTPENRKKATYLLGLAYLHIPITSFQVYRDMLLEQVIREFPDTEEAQRSYDLLSAEIERLSTGSSGLNLSPEDEARLKELKALAYQDVAENSH